MDISELKSMKNRGIIERTTEKHVTYSTIFDETNSKIYAINTILISKDMPIISMSPHNNTNYQKISDPKGKEVIVPMNFIWVDDNKEQLSQIKRFYRACKYRGYSYQDFRVMLEAFNEELPVIPEFNFGIILNDRIERNYRGYGEFTFMRNNIVTPKNKEERKYHSRDFSNLYLDYFMGLNYGDVIKSQKN
jgi:hypothetical protein